MPKRIRLDGYVGQDITAKSVSEILDTLSGEDVIVDLNTPGGLLYEGVEIYNRLIQYPGKKTLVMGALVASIGTLVSMAFDNIQAQDFSGFMIHNVSSGIFGDSKALRKEADEIERTNTLIATKLSQRSNKPVKEILKLMDAETWLYGQEIVDAGFADELIETGVQPDKAAASAAVAQMKETHLSRVAQTNIGNQGAQGVEIIKDEEIQMDKKELLEKLNTFRANGEITLLEIATALGVESQVITPEAVNALSVIGKLNAAGYKDPVLEIEALKKKAEEGEKAKLNQLLLEKFGPAKLKDDKENAVRRYAQQRAEAGIPIEEIEKDPVMSSLKAQSADYMSPQNQLGIVETTGSGSGKETGPKTVKY